LGPDGCKIRDIVSDADKLEAIGVIGIARCKEYTREQYFATHHTHIGDEELAKLVIQHAEEKLLRLKSEFIRTAWGKKMAEPLHDEMVAELEKMRQAGI
jgi:HD superfamily phosphodiesterase